MRLLVLFHVVLMMFLQTANAQNTQAPVVPELTVTIGPDAVFRTNGYVDGQIVVQVQLLSRHPFEALDFAMPQISGAEIIELQRPRTRKVTGYAGQGYVFETAIAVIPRTSGVLTIPPVTAVGHVEPVTDKELHFDLSSDAAEIKIAGISRHFESPWWLVSDRVEIDEIWSSPPEAIRIGEVIQRTVNLRVWGTTAERLPVIEHSRTRGVKVSLASSDLTTERSADGLIAHATYVWDLVAEPQQVAFIAPMGLDYWNPLEHLAKKAGLPGVRLEPLPANGEDVAAALVEEAEQRQKHSSLMVFFLVGIISLPVAGLAIAWVMTGLPTRADRRLRAGLVGAAPSRCYRLMDRWLTEAGWSKASFDHQFESRIALSDHLFGTVRLAETGTGPLLSDALEFSRRQRRQRLLDGLCSLWYS